MSRRSTTLLALTASALAAPALAGGYAEPAPQPYVAAPAPVVVVDPGADWTGASASVRLGYGRVDVDPGGAQDSGAAYGFGAAYDFDFGATVAGIGMSVDRLNIAPGGTDLDYVARVGGRLGADLGQSLVYATGGYAKVFTDTAVGDSGGYFAGIGSEVRLTQSLSLGSEILYHKFDSFSAAGVEADAITSTLSLNLRF